MLFIHMIIRRAVLMIELYWFISLTILQVIMQDLSQVKRIWFIFVVSVKFSKRSCAQLDS